MLTNLFLRRPPTPFPNSGRCRVVSGRVSGVSGTYPAVVLTGVVETSPGGTVSVVGG